jgi:hypothetical protein
VRRLIGAAAACGGSPDRNAIYLNVTPAPNDGTQRYTLNVKGVPVDGFCRLPFTTPMAFSIRTIWMHIRSTASQRKTTPMGL